MHAAATACRKLAAGGAYDAWLGRRARCRRRCEAEDLSNTFNTCTHSRGHIQTRTNTRAAQTPAQAISDVYIVLKLHSRLVTRYDACCVATYRARLQGHDRSCSAGRASGLACTSQRPERGGAIHTSSRARRSSTASFGCHGNVGAAYECFVAVWAPAIARRRCA